jgi:hypothetical protein
MNIKLTVTQIVKNQQRSTAVLQEQKDGKPDPAGAGMNLIFKNSKDLIL